MHRSQTLCYDFPLAFSMVKVFVDIYLVVCYYTVLPFNGQSEVGPRSETQCSLGAEYPVVECLSARGVCRVVVCLVSLHRSRRGILLRVRLLCGTSLMCLSLAAEHQELRPLQDCAGAHLLLPAPLVAVRAGR